MKETSLAWLAAAYKIFALEGKSGLKIERLARLVGLSKSSFYHHFVDFDFFFEMLLAYHEERILQLLEAEKMCERLVPDFIDLCLERKDDLFFHQKVRTLRSDTKIDSLLKRMDTQVMHVFLSIWSKEIKGKWSLDQLQSLYPLASEYFFSNLTEDSFQKESLSELFQKLLSLSDQFT
ncbi:transcriptional regulator, TetR family [Leptospira ryugenii]|uniref:Transcriptional regulator, TetR family n=1 Tax=Leptospira ryugenii TaxID=1917863 RepID=A0A2P2DZQ6_9LEPT|nr:TetR family transcriptional regulator [Leptospira ryugenii]GBF50118.1 transcriptional regulator, TetR family [Leptospira ryugenii]